MSSNKISNEPKNSDETQTSAESDYEAHSGAQPSDSVYDFLYQDVRRVGSFLAQFEKYGPRTSIKATESVGSAQTVRGSATGTLGLPAVMGASAIVDGTTTDDTKDVAEHTFDPLWSNARLLLDYLATGDHIDRDLWRANIGGFVMITGSITVIDLQLVGNIVKNPVLKREMLEGMYRAQNAKKGSPQAKEMERNIEILSSLPHTLQISVFGHNESSNVQAWSSITSESLTTTASDIILKHGVVVRGFWNVLGILDAVPDVATSSDENPDGKTLDEMVIPALQKDFAQAAAGFASATRELIGRPRTMFGITPILVFREVTKANNQS